MILITVLIMDRPTNQLTHQRTDMRGNRKVALPIKDIYIINNGENDWVLTLS